MSKAGRRLSVRGLSIKKYRLKGKKKDGGLSAAVSLVFYFVRIEILPLLVVLAVAVCVPAFKSLSSLAMSFLLALMPFI